MTSATALWLNFRYAFRVHKPLLMLRLGEAVTRAMLLGQVRLRYVDFAIDFTCNLRCEHCFATTLARPQGRRMAVEDYRRVAEEAMALGAVNFSFQGGEPLLDPRLDEIIRACSPDRNLISVSTNGTLLDARKVRELRRSGVDILTVSLDSSIPEEHDRFRGCPGTYRRATEGIQVALRQGLHVTLGTVVTHANLRSEGIRGLLELAVRLRCILYLIFPVPAGRWREGSAMLLDEEDLKTIERYTQSSPYIRTDLQANLGGHGCGAAKEILYLTPHGDVLTCPFLHITPGSVFEEPLASIRARALRQPEFARYHQRCLASTDREFIARRLSKTFSAKQLPIAWQEAFGADPADGCR